MDPTTGKLIAIKSIQVSDNKDTAQKEVLALKHEIALLTKLHHPNIVNYIDTRVLPEENRVEIVLEFVPGGSVKALLDKFGPLSEKVTKLYTKQLLDGLSYVHSKGVMHRDLKCANILVDNDAHIKISDFGASTIVKSNYSKDIANQSKSLKGSPYWISPEVF